MNAAPTTPRSWTIELPLVPLSMNRRERTSWHVRRAEKIRIEQYVWALASAARVPRLTVDVPALGGKTERKLIGRGRRRAVSIEIQKGPTSRQRDDAPNREARAKSILDALVRCGYLVDDAEAWLDWRGVTESRSADGPRTLITIEEIDET